MKLFAFLLLSALAFVQGQTPIVATDGQRLVGSVSQGNDVIYQFEVPEPSTSASFEFFPCSGASEFLVGINRIPTIDVSDFAWQFPAAGLPEDAPQLFLDTFSSNNLPVNTTLYARVLFSPALNIFNGDQTPSFEAIFLSQAQDPYPEAPVPSGITLSQRTDTSVVASWNPSPSEATQSLQYCLYGHPEEGHQGIDLHGSACYSSTQNDDFFGCTQETSFTITTIDPAAWHLDLIVVQTQGPQLSSYIFFTEIEEADENNAASALALPVFASLSLLLAFLF